MYNIFMVYYCILDSLFLDFLLLLHNLLGLLKGENKSLYGFGSIARLQKLYSLSWQNITGLGYRI